MSANLDGVRASHPQLTHSVIAQYNKWRKIVTGDTTLAKWEDEVFGGPAFMDRLSDALLLDGDVLAMGDQECLALYPGIVDSGAPDTPTPSGKKAKWVGPPLPAMLAVLERALVLIHESNGNSLSVGVVPRESMESATPVTLRSLWVTMPGVQYAYRDGARRRVLTAQLSDMASRQVYAPIQLALTESLHSGSGVGLAQTPQRIAASNHRPSSDETVHEPSTRHPSSDSGLPSGPRTRTAVILGVVGLLLAAALGGLFLVNRGNATSNTAEDAQSGLVTSQPPQPAEDPRGEPGHQLSKGEIIQYLQDYREPVAEDDVEYEVVPVERDGAVSMLITDPDTGTAQLGATNGLTPVPEDQVTREGGKATAAVGYQTLMLGDLANDYELDAQWKRLCVPVSEQDDPCLSAKSPTRAGLATRPYVYDQESDTFTHRETGDVFQADEVAGQYVSAQTGEALVPGWKPGT